WATMAIKLLAGWKFPTATTILPLSPDPTVDYTISRIGSTGGMTYELQRTRACITESTWRPTQPGTAPREVNACTSSTLWAIAMKCSPGDIGRIRVPNRLLGPNLRWAVRSFTTTESSTSST